MEYGTSIFDEIQTEEQRETLIKELENELLINYKEEEKEYYKLIFHDTESTIVAEFYHICKIKKIECHLQVKVKNGLIDAMIFINNKYYIIECKYSHKKRSISSIARSAHCKKQLKTYINTGYKIIIINNKHTIELILNILKKKILIEDIYYYNYDLNDLSPLIINL